MPSTNFTKTVAVIAMITTTVVAVNLLSEDNVNKFYSNPYPYVEPAEKSD
jgi:hypothetical protein